MQTASAQLVLRCTPTLSEIAEQYLAERQHLNKSTLRKYKHTLQAHLLPRFGHTPWELVDAKEIGIFRSELAATKSGRTVNGIIGLLKTLTLWASQRALIDNSARQVTAMSSVRESIAEVDPFTQEEIELVLRCVKPRFRQYFACAAWTGARPSELMALRWKDIDWDRNEIDINKARVRGVEGGTKTKSSQRRIPMFTPVRVALEVQKAFSYSDENQYVFTNTNHGPLIKGLDGIWKRACIRAGVRHRPAYQLRHSFASHCLAAGEAPGYVAKLLGHSNLEITFRCYARWIRNERRDGRCLESAIFERYEQVAQERGSALSTEPRFSYKKPREIQIANPIDLHIDPFDRFLLERTTRGDGLSVTAHDLHDAYVSWSAENGLKPAVRNVFGRWMTARGWCAAKVARGRYKYLGIGVAPTQRQSEV